MADIIRLDAARTRVSIAPEFGGRVAQIEALHHGAWVSLLYDGGEIPIEERDPLSWGSFVMAPWPNRIAQGQFTWRGETITLPRNVGGHALHGVAFDGEWTVDAKTGTACVLSHSFDSRWPYGGRVRQRIEALDDGVSQTLEVEATDRAFPAGVAWHPYFRRSVGGAEHVHVLVDASERYELDGMIPTEKMLPLDGPYDLRGYPPLGNRLLDDCYRGVNAPMRIRWGDLELWMDSTENLAHAVVYTAEHVFCVEPQSCANDAFNLEARGIGGVGVIVVEPGSPLIATTTWRWASAAPLGE